MLRCYGLKVEAGSEGRVGGKGEGREGSREGVERKGERRGAGKRTQILRNFHSYSYSLS